MGLFIFMILPTNAGLTETNILDGTNYGAATIVVHDVNGNERFSQTIHNLLTDAGENYILDAIFDDGNDVEADGASIGTICISDPNNALQVIDTEAATDFDGDNSIGETNCIQDDADGVTTLLGIATIGPLTFDVPTHAGNGDTVEGIGICNTVVGDDNAFLNCANGAGGSGILFSVINTSNVTLATGEDVDITYTFDISSSSN